MAVDEGANIKVGKQQSTIITYANNHRYFALQVATRHIWCVFRVIFGIRGNQGFLVHVMQAQGGTIPKNCP